MNKVITAFGIKIKLPLYSSCYLPDTKMLEAQNIEFPHPIGIVIARSVKLGKNCVIYQNVTIGAKKRNLANNRENFPTLGDNVIVYAGACIIGGIKIGNNVQIGANAVVTKDIPANGGLRRARPSRRAFCSRAARWSARRTQDRRHMRRSSRWIRRPRSSE